MKRNIVVVIGVLLAVLVIGSVSARYLASRTTPLAANPTSTSDSEESAVSETPQPDPTQTPWIITTVVTETVEVIETVIVEVTSTPEPTQTPRIIEVEVPITVTERITVTEVITATPLPPTAPPVPPAPTSTPAPPAQEKECLVSSTTEQAQRLTGVSVQRIDTECSAFVWRGAPEKTVVATCSEGWTCTWDVKDDIVVVHEGVGQSAVIHAGTFREVSAYPMNDDVHDVCRLFENERDLGLREDPSFRVRFQAVPGGVQQCS